MSLHFFVFCDINLQLCKFLVTLLVSLTQREPVFVYNDQFVPTAGFFVNRDQTLKFAFCLYMTKFEFSRIRKCKGSSLS